MSYITKSTLNLDMICAMAANLVGITHLGPFRRPT